MEAHLTLEITHGQYRQLLPVTNFRVDRPDEDAEVVRSPSWLFRFAVRANVYVALSTEGDNETGSSRN